MIPQLIPPLAGTCLKRAETIQSRNDRRARNRQQRGGPIQRALRLHAPQHDKRNRAADDAHLHDLERVHAAHDGALQQRGDQADEAEELARVFGLVGEEVVGHEGQGEFHAAEEEDEGEVGGVEEGVGVCADQGFGGGGFGVPVGGAVGGWGRGWERLGEADVEVDGLCDDEEEREAGGHGEGVGGHDLEGGEVCA